MQRTDATDVEARLKVFDRILRVQARRARLLGLDAPEKREVDLRTWNAGDRIVREVVFSTEDAETVARILQSRSALPAIAGGPAHEVIDAAPLGPAGEVAHPEVDAVHPAQPAAEAGGVPPPPLP
jgi:hypothetical protein